MENFKLDGDFIKLGQLLKAANLVQSGGDAKEVIGQGEVFVNGEPCTMRGRKIKKGDMVSYGGRGVFVE